MTIAVSSVNVTDTQGDWKRITSSEQLTESYRQNTGLW